MTTTVNLTEMKEELVVFLRNKDILTTTQRNVTTTNDAGSWTAESNHLIDVPNIKNIRGITVDATPLVFGTDYNVDYSYDDSGTIKCRITLTNPQTGAYDIEYDYGTDKIFSDLPKTTLNISSFPRIGVDFIGINTSELGIGGYSNVTDVSLSIYVYDPKTGAIDDFMQSIRTAIMQNKKTFYYFSFVTLVTVGPTLVFIDGKQKIYQRNIDIVSLDNVEEA